jgi:cell division GTPase FtsZ
VIAVPRRARRWHFTVGVVTKPFEFEGGRRMTNADNGLAELGGRGL